MLRKRVISRNATLILPTKALASVNFQQYQTPTGVKFTDSFRSSPPPPLINPESPQPLPPPVLFAAVGLALAPPWVAIGWWLGIVSPVRFEDEDGVAIFVVESVGCLRD